MKLPDPLKREILMDDQKTQKAEKSGKGERGGTLSFLHKVHTTQSLGFLLLFMPTAIAPPFLYKNNVIGTHSLSSHGLESDSEVDLIKWGRAKWGGDPTDRDTEGDRSC